MKKVDASEQTTLLSQASSGAIFELKLQASFTEDSAGKLLLGTKT